MKSYVILFCVLVYCSKIVEPNPLSEDFGAESASKNINLPANNANRQYENPNIARYQIGNPSYAYQQPTGQQYKQQWQNNENYRTYNQFNAHQPDNVNYRNGINNNNWVYSNYPVKVAAAPPVLPAENKLLNPSAGTFFSSPSVQNQHAWTNNAEYRPVNEQHYQWPRVRQQAAVFQKPTVQSLTQPQYIVPANNRPIETITPIKPVEVVVQNPANSNLPTRVQSLIKSDKVQNALNANKYHRGFTIVHPNGTVIHVDDMETIHKSYPKYIMMNVGGIVPNQNNKLSFPTTPGPLSPLAIDPAPVQVTPSPRISSNPIASSQVTNPAKPIWYPQWNKPYYNPNNEQVAVPNGATNIPPPNKVWPAYKPLNFSSIPVIPALPPQNQITTPLPNIAITPSLEDVVTTPKMYEVSEPKIDADSPPVLAVVSEDAPVTSPSDESVNYNPTTVVSTPITTAPTALTDDSTSLPDDTIGPLGDALTTVLTPTTQSFITPDITPAVTLAITPDVTSGVTPDVTFDVTPDVTPDAPPDVTPDVIPDVLDSTSPVPTEPPVLSSSVVLDQIWNLLYYISTSKSDEDPISTPGAVSSDSTTPTPIVNIPVTTTSSTESSISIDITTSNDVDNDNDDNNDGDTIITISPIEIPINDSSNEPDGTLDISTTVIAKTDAITTNLETAAVVNDNSIVKAPYPPALNEVIAEIDMSNHKTTNKPVEWIKATKSEFWEKLTKENDCDAIYFLQLHPQPIIQKDSKTTVFPNGTIYEEITETKWEGKDDTEPRTTKTIKITHQ